MRTISDFEYWLGLFSFACLCGFIFPFMLYVYVIDFEFALSNFKIFSLYAFFYGVMTITIFIRGEN